MQSTTKLRQSRDGWREKAKNRNQSIRTLRRRLARRDERVLKLEAEIQALETKFADMKNGRPASSPPVVSLTDAYLVRALCVLIVIIGVVSFRSVPRILTVLSNTAGLDIPWIPHFSSVINWTLRVGLARLNAVASIAEPWIAIVDASIDVSVKKALVVLRVKLSALADKEQAIELSDCECIGIKVSTTWNGELVSDALSEIFAVAGKPDGILKDGGTDLSRGVVLYRERNDAKDIVVIDDVGHVTANVLKASFSKLKAFKNFLASIKSGGAKLRQSDLAFLTPPKVRTKGRFQSIMKVAEWGAKILELIGGSGRQAEGSLAERLRGFLPGFGKHRPFIEEFARTSKVITEFLKITKNRGINQKSFCECQSLLATLPERSKVRKKLMKWLTKHLRIQCRLGIGQMPLIVSSDIIETLMGKFKVILQRNDKAEFNRIVLGFPCLCGQTNEAEVLKALQDVTHRDLEGWEKSFVTDSQAKRRRKILPPKPRRSGPKSVRPPTLKAG